MAQLNVLTDTPDAAPVSARELGEFLVRDGRGLPVELFARQQAGEDAVRVEAGYGLPTADAPVLAALQAPFRYASSVTITCVAGSDYAAGDVWGPVATDTIGRATYIPNLARSQGQLITITAIRAISSNASLLNRMRLQWFSSAPVVAEVEMDDNAVFALNTAGGRDKWVGSTLMGAFTTKGTAELIGAQEILRPQATETGLFLVLTTEDAETNEAANQTVRLDFYTL